MRNLLAAFALALAIGLSETASAAEITFNACPQAPLYRIKPDTEQRPSYDVIFTARSDDGGSPPAPHSLNLLIKYWLPKATLDYVNGSEQAGWNFVVSAPASLFEVLHKEIFSGDLLAVMVNWNASAPRNDFTLNIWRVGRNPGHC